MKKIIRIIVENLTTNYPIKHNNHDLENVEIFVLNEINGAPSYVKLVVKTFSLILLSLFLFSNLFNFYSKNSADSFFFLLKKKKIPILKELLTLYESLILLRLLEKTHEK